MIAILLTFLLQANLLTEQIDATAFKTGKELEQALATEIRWSSASSQLADQLQDLQDQAGVFILRDRRIDPHQLISVKTEFVSLAQVLRMIAETIPDGACCFTENLTCVGSSDAVYCLPILLEQRIKETAAIRKKLGAGALRGLTARLDGSWEDLSEPRQILISHAKNAGIKITNPEAIPHDLWAAENLPKMAFIELATVILHQFDLTFELSGDGSELTVVPIDSNGTVEHRYFVGGKLKSAVASTWMQQLPDIKVDWAGPYATISATLRQHALLYGLLQDEIYSVSAKDLATETPGISIRTTNFRFSAERATVGQLIEFFRNQGVAIEIVNEDSPELKELLKQMVDLSADTERQPGHKLFPRVFGKHFPRVDVLDERVVLSLE